MGKNNRPDRIPESLCRTNYWYRTEFAPPKMGKDERVWVNFDGVNYIGEVWINGHDVGSVRGTFARGRFDVTPFVKPGERMAVAVEIFPPPGSGRSGRADSRRSASVKTAACWRRTA